MEKYAQIQQDAFFNELEKLGGVATLAARVLTKQLPKLLAMGRSASEMTGSGVVQNTYRFLSRAGQKGLSLGDTYRKGAALAARKWGSPLESLARTRINVKGNPGLANAPRVRPKFFGAERGAVATAERSGRFTGDNAISIFKNPAQWAKTRPQAWTGEIATNLNHINRKGVADFVKHQWKSGQTFTRDGFRYARTPVGKLTSPLLSTGLGFGGISFALGGKDPVTGRKVNIVKRTARAAGEAATWSLAPSVAMAAITPGIIKDVGGLAKSMKSN